MFAYPNESEIFYIIIFTFLVKYHALDFPVVVFDCKIGFGKISGIALLILYKPHIFLLFYVNHQFRVYFARILHHDLKKENFFLLLPFLLSSFLSIYISFSRTQNTNTKHSYRKSKHTSMVCIYFALECSHTNM